MSDTTIKQYTKEEQAANRAKWVEALRSDEYEQGRYALATEDGGYCCLGVACELAAKEGVIGPCRADTYEGEGALLPLPVQVWLGLADNAGETKDYIEYGTPEDQLAAGGLTELNDAAGYTFQQIADVIDGGLVKLKEDGREDV